MNCKRYNNLNDFVLGHAYPHSGSHSCQFPHQKLIGGLHRYSNPYLDKIQLWDIAGPTHPSSQSPYNFTVNWRKQLSGVTASSLTLYNFKTGSHNILSFQAEIYPWVSSARVTLKINGTKSSIIFLAFSIVLKTDQSNFWEQHTLIFSPTHGYRAHQYLPVPSQLQGQLKYYSVLLQWITAANPDSSYATYLFLLDYLHSNQSV